MERGGSSRYALATLRSVRTGASGCADSAPRRDARLKGREPAKVLRAKLDNQTWAVFGRQPPLVSHHGGIHLPSLKPQDCVSSKAVSFSNLSTQR